VWKNFFLPQKLAPLLLDKQQRVPRIPFYSANSKERALVILHTHTPAYALCFKPMENGCGAVKRSLREADARFGITRLALDTN